MARDRTKASSRCKNGEYSGEDDLIRLDDYFGRVPEIRLGPLDGDGPVSEQEDADVGRAPICSYCGVTALPADLSNVIDSVFVCDNADCDAYGEVIES
jgi:hypothetical protein